MGGQPRTTEVRFYCSANSPHPNNYFDIEEPGTCTYTVHFFTSALCYLDEFKLLPDKVAPIICYQLPAPLSPALDPGTGTLG
eukprot:NODE_6703_length_439_cov_99.664103_g5123_i0.p1 GENE.NODE_6703_length_439_cov_99.664103_g5123_i0~~NODE_6703_length_439_cov_99.664103_g5123_i0.p1  ORF type:complete len:92 (+),score=24.74 NODE_6703_length_439_cov_99.664103_g5123_i0:33-278(+)